jgi:hypothetical protein
MARTEAGHAKNMSNYDELITYVIGYGAIYNPSKSSLIDLSALLTLQPQVHDTAATVNRLAGVFNSARAARKTAFAPLSKLITTIVNVEQTCNASIQIDENVKSLVRKMRGLHSKINKSNAPVAAPSSITGTTTTTSTPSVTTTKRTISSSQVGFNTLLDTFDKLIQTLIIIPEYQPNEAHITTASLTTLYNELLALNASVVSAHVDLSNAKIARFNICYKPITGMVDRTVDVKKYVKAIFGSSSAEYKQISKLNFRNYPLF